MEGVLSLQKRKRATEGNQGDGGGREESGAEEEVETAMAGSEEFEMRTQSILERIDRFTQQVSELLEAGKTLFKELSSEFEERVINIHREQMEKWQEEIKDLRVLDASNEASRALLQNAHHHILRNVNENA